jgi:hypothetical protein
MPIRQNQDEKTDHLFRKYGRIIQKVNPSKIWSFYKIFPLLECLYEAENKPFVSIMD